MTQPEARLGLTPTPVRSPASSQEPPLQEVLVELWQNMQKLLRQEVALGRAELDVKAQKLKADLLGAAAGAGLMLAGVLALVAALILLLALVMPAWVAALATGGAASGIGFALIKSQRPTLADVTPQRTLDNLKRDVQAITEPNK